MPIEFDITLTPRDMYRFNMYQAYSGSQGFISVILSVIAFVMAGMTYGTVELLYTALYIIFGIILLIYIPASLYLRSKQSLAASKVLREPLHYKVTEDGFHVSQGEENAQLPWEQIYKMTATKSLVLVYSSRIHAYVIPRAQLGNSYMELAKLAGRKLPKHRIKMK